MSPQEPLKAKEFKLGENYTPFTDYKKPVYASSNTEANKAFGLFSTVFSANNILTKWKNITASKIYEILGKDYHDTITDGKVDAVMDEITDSLFNSVFKGYFGQEAQFEGEFKNWVRDNLIGTENPIRASLTVGERVNYQIVPQILDYVAGQASSSLTRTSVYDELISQENLNLAKEVGVLYHKFLGGATEGPEIVELGKVQKTKDVVQRLMNLDRRIEQTMNHYDRTSNPKNTNAFSPSNLIIPTTGIERLNKNIIEPSLEEITTFNKNRNT